MKISIITPTLQRESLRRCCESIDRQSYMDWEHIVVADSDQKDYTIWDWHQIRDEKRLLMRSPKPTRNFGNTQRHIAWQFTDGDFIMYLDDDNYLADENVLRDIATAVSDVEYWAIFPILRHGRHFFYDPPGSCYVDTANMVIRREIGQWPNRDEYTLDGIFCDELKAKYPYAAFPNMRPIVVMETSGRGE